MKENKYDDDEFFEKYSQMNRSKSGLKAAGEWLELQKILPDFKEKSVLDLGCGYGWHCKYAVENGAKSALGTDISQKMLDKAQKINFDNKIKYICLAMEDLKLPDNEFDIILSSLALHYIKDYKSIVQNIYKWLKPGGLFIFSAEHPIFTSYGTQDWYYDKNGKILHFPVDNYYCEGEREAFFLGQKVTKYHRTLTTYLNTLLENNLIIKNIIEPKPPEKMRHLPEMQNEMRRPMMLIVSALKMR